MTVEKKSYFYSFYKLRTKIIFDKPEKSIIKVFSTLNYFYNIIKIFLQKSPSIYILTLPKLRNMGSSGLVILLVAFAFFVVVGISATSELIGEANESNNSEIATAASGVSSTLSPLWTIMSFGILIIGAYAVIHSYSKM